MERKIKGTVKSIIKIYVFFWVIPVKFVFLAECDLFPVGCLVGNTTANYLLETLAILLTALCVPLSLKLFSKVLKKQVDGLTITLALKRYYWWNVVRLSILALPLLLNLAIYYLLLSNTGLLCALIIITASLFCVPGEARLRSELKIYKD